MQFRSRVNRIEKLSYSDHLFLFGARGTGKTTLIRDLFQGKYEGAFLPRQKEKSRRINRQQLSGRGTSYF